MESAATQDEAEEGGQPLGESWLNLTASVTGAGKQKNPVPSESFHAQMEEKRIIKELACEHTMPLYPLCEGCTAQVMAELAAARDQARKDCEMYETQFALLSQREQEEDSNSREQIEEDLRQAEEEEQALIEKSHALELERTALRKKMTELEQNAVLLEQMQKCYWREYNDLQLQLRSSDRDSLRRKIDNVTMQLEALNKTNVINDAFYISHSEIYGTINGFRLGSVPSQPVEWEEINAAWGQTALLLQTLVSCWDFTFPLYRVAPMGSFSRIIKRDDDKCVWDLYCQSDMGFGRLFGYGSFDKGMAAFLECVRALQDHVRSVDTSFSPPYRIVDHKVEEFSVKLQFNTYERWTKALKYMLTNIKWLVASSLSRRS